MANEIINIENLSYGYGSKSIYKELSFSVEEGSVFGVLGKNGVGKSTLINILMGFLKPLSGSCKICGEDSDSLSEAIKSDIALLHEGFTAYDFMSIEEYERFFSAFYPRWKKRTFYDLVDMMKLDYSQKLSTLSFGQKSQVVLGAIFAQDARLLILDDYSMGLDAGYRRLFIDYLKLYIKNGDKTVLITSHVMSDLEGLIKDMVILKKGGEILRTSMSAFIDSFRCYEFGLDVDIELSSSHSIETLGDTKRVFSFDRIQGAREVGCSFEDKFLGYVGKY